MATCPICSPHSPQYFSGSLCWFPSEGCLRAIGHNCAENHFGSARHQQAILQGRHRRAIQQAEDFLLETLPKIAELRIEAESLVSVAKEIDHLRDIWWSKASKSGCQRLVRMGSKGVLTIEVTREIAAVNAYGQEIKRREIEEAARYPISGLSFLVRKFSVSNLVQNTIAALSQVKAVDEEEALKLICDELIDDSHKLEAEKLTRKAIKSIEELRKAVAEAYEFVSIENLRQLSEWSCDRRSGAPFSVLFDKRYPHIIRLQRPGKHSVEIRIPETLMQKDAN